MIKHKKKTEIEISDEILKKNLPKAAEVLVSLLESKDVEVQAHAAAYIIERTTGRPILVITIKE